MPCAVGGAHQTPGVKHQHAIGHGFDDDFVDLHLRAGRQLAHAGHALFAYQTNRQLIGQNGHHKEPHTREARLQKARGNLAHGTHRIPPGVE